MGLLRAQIRRSRFRKPFFYPIVTLSIFVSDIHNHLLEDAGERSQSTMFVNKIFLIVKKLLSLSLSLSLLSSPPRE
jgi:hypothetical protein